MPRSYFETMDGDCIVYQHVSCWETDTQKYINSPATKLLTVYAGDHKITLNEHECKDFIVGYKAWANDEGEPMEKPKSTDDELLAKAYQPTLPLMREYRKGRCETNRVAIISGYQSGKTSQEISEIIGISPRSINRWRDDNAEFNQQCVAAQSFAKYANSCTRKPSK